MTATAYRQLLQEYVPRPIRSERARQKTLRVVDELMSRPRLSRAKANCWMFSLRWWNSTNRCKILPPAIHPTTCSRTLWSRRAVSQAAVAAGAGVPRSTITAVLAGRRAISRENIAKLAGFFGVSPTVFLSPVMPRLPAKDMEKPRPFPTAKRTTK